MGKDRISGDDLVQVVLMVKHAVDDKVQLTGTGHGANLVVEFVAGESPQNGTAAKAMAHMVGKNRVKVGYSRKEYLAAAAETIQGVGKDRAYAYAEIGIICQFVDSYLRAPGQMTDGAEIGTMAIMIEKGVFIYDLLTERFRQLPAGKGAMGAEGNDYGDICAGNAFLSENIEDDFEEDFFW